VNRQITRLALTGLALMIALVVATTYWQTWAAAGLKDRQDNAIERVAQFTIKRGEITDRGRRLARNRVRKVSGRTLYFRRYPQGKLTAHIVGYSTVERSRAGLERSMNDFLTASNQNLSTVFDRTLDKLQGSTVTGNDLRLTMSLRGQQAAYDALAGRCGAVAAVEVKTGKLLVSASSPTYDPNLVEGKFDLIGKIQAPCRRPDALFNRAMRGLYPPGSTFKIVTAAAALESGRFRPTSSFVDPGYCEVYGKRVNNYDTTSPFGRLTLADAMRYSVNSVFCNIGKELGSKALVAQSKRFGFYELPPLETPESERAASGLYSEGRLFDPKLDSDVDPGRYAFGQERNLVTPIQMAMATAGIANDGVVMRPYVVERVVSPDGDVVRRTKPDELGRALSAGNAAALREMMISVVEGGTGTAARISGLEVGGKTGTAETGIRGSNHVWFVCFAGPEGGEPEIAVAVVVEEQSSTGGQTSAPIAREVVQALLPSAANS
jgi:peptidoglycan glycosyltransferase